MFFMKKRKNENYEIVFFGLPIEIHVVGKQLITIYFLDGSWENRISVDFRYRKEPGLFEKHLILLLKDLYYNYIKEGIIFHEFEEQFKKLVDYHFGG